MRNALLSCSAAALAMIIDTASASTPATVELTIAGSSAQRPAFKAAFDTLCIGGSSEFVASDGTDLHAFTCTLNNDPAVALEGVVGQPATVWYRGEGDSAYAAAASTGSSIYRLNVDGTCTPGVPGICTATFNLATETGTGNVELAAVDLGVSDIEPTRLSGENWPANPAAISVLGSTPPTSFIPRLNGVVFGIAVSDSGATASITDISRAAITGIFSGKYTNWSQVPNPSGTGKFPVGTIHVCRGNPGSGAQAGASIYFNHYACSNSSYAFVPGGGRIHVNNSIPAIKKCLSGAVNGGFDGAIGFYSGDPAAPAAHTHFVTIDMIANTKTKAATGNYDFLFEGAYEINGSSSSLKHSPWLANLLITKLGDINQIPAGPTIALPGTLSSGVTNIATTPLTMSVNGIPVSLYTNAGNSCSYRR